MIHFCLLPSSQTFLSASVSWGRTKVCGKKSQSLLPQRPAILDRFRHSLSLRPIWKVPGKWLICKIERKEVERDFLNITLNRLENLGHISNGRSEWNSNICLEFEPPSILHIHVCTYVNLPATPATSLLSIPSGSPWDAWKIPLSCACPSTWSINYYHLQHKHKHKH